MSNNILINTIYMHIYFSISTAAAFRLSSSLSLRARTQAELSGA